MATSTLPVHTYVMLFSVTKIGVACIQVNLVTTDTAKPSAAKTAAAHDYGAPQILLWCSLLASVLQKDSNIRCCIILKLIAMLHHEVHTHAGRPGIH